MEKQDNNEASSLMKSYRDSLRGYGHHTHVHYNFTCQYCGYDGRAFPNWFQLTVDHILPRNQGGTDTDDNKITVCQACNSITSRMTFSETMTREDIIIAKRQHVQQRQAEYFEFWKTHVAPLYLGKTGDKRERDST